MKDCRENCDPERKQGEGKEKCEPPGKVMRVCRSAGRFRDSNAPT